MSNTANFLGTSTTDLMALGSINRRISECVLNYNRKDNENKRVHDILSNDNFNILNIKLNLKKKLGINNIHKAFWFFLDLHRNMYQPLHRLYLPTFFFF